MFSRPARRLITKSSPLTPILSINSSIRGDSNRLVGCWSQQSKNVSLGVSEREREREASTLITVTQRRWFIFDYERLLGSLSLSLSRFLGSPPIYGGRFVGSGQIRISLRIRVCLLSSRDPRSGSWIVTRLLFPSLFLRCKKFQLE